MKRIRQVATISAFFVALAITGLAADTFTALTGTGAGGAYQFGDRWGAQTAEKVRQNFNALVAPKYWTAASDSNLTNEVNLGALTSGLLKIAVSGSVATPSTVAAPTGAVVGTSDSQVLTGKTYDAEATGNVLTLPFTVYWPAAICDQGGAYQPQWSSNGSGMPAYNCVFGTNTTFAELTFDDSTSEQIFQHLRLPNDWTGTIDLRLSWRSVATSGNVVWQVQTACAADGEVVDPAWNTAQVIVDAAQGSASRLNTATQTGVTTTGCSAGETLFFRILRDPAHASDTLGASAFLIGAEIAYRRAI